MARSLAWLDRMPLKRKLVVMIILVMTASFGVSEFITGMYGYRADRRAMEHHLHTLASAIGDNCSAALVFDDEDAAAQILSALEFEPAITAAVLTDDRSVVVARFPDNPRAGDPRDAAGARPGFFGGTLRVDRRITVDGDTVGYLTIWAETEAILARAATEAIVGFTAFALGVLVVLFLFERMQRIVTAPLVDLHETVRKVVRSRNYSIRAARSADDELNDVVMAINDLLAQVEERIPPAPPSTDPRPAPREETPTASR